MQLINEAIKMGYVNKSFGLEAKHIGYLLYGDHGITNILEDTHIGYHELFSKDSGLMEYMEWDGGLLNAYKNMSYLTAQDKVIYFDTYAKLPGDDERII